MKKRGFTFTEIIVSVAIISLVAAGTFSAFVGVQYIFNRARHRLQAFNFAREAVDKMRSAYQWGDAVMQEQVAPYEENDIIRGEMSNLESKLEYTVEDTEPQGYKTVVVTVSWDETSF